MIPINSHLFTHYKKAVPNIRSVESVAMQVFWDKVLITDPGSYHKSFHTFKHRGQQYLMKCSEYEAGVDLELGLYTCKIVGGMLIKDSLDQVCSLTIPASVVYRKLRDALVIKVVTLLLTLVTIVCVLYVLHLKLSALVQ